MEFFIYLSKLEKLIIFPVIFIFLMQSLKSQDERYGYVSPVGTAEFEFRDKKDPSNKLQVSCAAVVSFRN